MMALYPTALHALRSSVQMNSMNTYSSVIKYCVFLFLYIIAQVCNPIQLMMPIALSLSQGEKRLE